MSPGPCTDYQLPLERFGDGESDVDESLRVREHLAACPPCRIALRSVTELNRRIAQAPHPPTPPDLEARIRRALAEASRPARRRLWIPAAAAAALLVGAALFLRPTPARAEIPAFVAAAAAAHDSFLSGTVHMEENPSPDALRDYFLKQLKTEVAAPGVDDCACVGGCGCSLRNTTAPWILYRRGGTPISLILVADPAASLPEASRRSRAGRVYHFFKAGANSVVVCRAGADAHVWISRLPDEELAACALDAREGRVAVSGEKLSIRGLCCRACGAKAEARAKKIDGVADAKVNLASMELTVTGKKGLDLDQLVRELREAGLDVRAK